MWNALAAGTTIAVILSLWKQQHTVAVQAWGQQQHTSRLSVRVVGCNRRNTAVNRGGYDASWSSLSLESTLFQRGGASVKLSVAPSNNEDDDNTQITPERTLIATEVDLMPKLDEDAPAVDFLRDVAFYFGNEDARDRTVPKLIAEFGNMTMREVLGRFDTEGELVNHLFDLEVDIRTRWIVLYYNSLPRTISSIEEMLDRERIIPLGSDNEIELVKERYLPLNQRLLTQVLGDKRNSTRELNAYMVLGSSGSGKTFFAVEDAATANVEGLKAVVYFTPEDVTERPDEFVTEYKDPKTLVSWIKNELKDDINERDRVFEYTSPLNMHLSIVIDEAGATELDGYFEKKRILQKLCSALKELATSTRLVVCGTGLDARKLSSKSDLYKFQMEQWGRDELQDLMMSVPAMKLNGVTGQKHAIAAVDAILNQPTLCALSTNARSAFFLLVSVEASYKRIQEPVNWVDEMESRVVDHVNYAVAEYIRNNALQDLGPDKTRRFLVAASVLRAVEAGQNSKEIPKFPDLPYQFRYLARCLVDLNVEDVGKKTVYCDEKKPRSVLVSPAIVIVLAALLGVEAKVLAHCEPQELVTVLYAVGTLAHEAYSPFADASLALQNDWAAKKRCRVVDLWDRVTSAEDAELCHAIGAMRRKLDSNVDELAFVRLLKPVPASSLETSILVPRFGKNAIWINGLGAPFADVVAPYALYLCRPCTDDHIIVDLRDELHACGLLKEQSEDSSGRVVLRALLRNWESSIDDLQSVEVEAQSIQRPNASRVAYPFNMLDTLSKRENTSYDMISKMNDGIWKINGKEMLPATPASISLRLIISTNTNDVTLSVDGNEIPLTVVGAHVETKDLHKQECYSAFLRDVVDGVDIEFLLT